MSSPHCDNHFVIEAEEPQLAVGIEADDPRVNGRFIKDPRMKLNELLPEHLM